MAGTRGYYSYRGRRSKGKIALTLLLIVIILAAVVVMLLQRNIVYDENGTPRLELPWKTEGPSADDAVPGPDELDLTIEEAPTEPLAGELAQRIYALPTNVLTVERWEAAQAAAQAENCDAVAITLKDNGGNVYFDAAAAHSVKTADDSAAALVQIAEKHSEYYTVARLSCFQDPRAADSNTASMGLMNTGGYIFYDGNNSRWLDPGKTEARRYLLSLIREAAELGFDEILLTDVSYPLEGKLSKIQYGEGDRTEKLMGFLEEVRTELEPYSVALSVEVTETTLAEGQDDAAGLVLTEVASVADRIYAQTAAERVEQYAAAVQAADQAVTFVPELSADEAGELECVLISN